MKRMKRRPHKPTIQVSKTERVCLSVLDTGGSIRYLLFTSSYHLHDAQGGDLGAVRGSIVAKLVNRGWVRCEHDDLYTKDFRITEQGRAFAHVLTR
jgi:hypothetical protein